MQNPQFDQNLGSWDISKVSNMNNMFFQTTLSIGNYDATLIGWATDLSGNATDGIDDIPSGITLHGGSNNYCLAIDSRNTLTNAPYNWSITDGGTTCASTDFFVTTWEITTNNEEIALPIVDTSLDFTVDWGDGTITNETEEAYHTYANAGT